MPDLPSIVVSHISLGTNDFRRAKAFYGTVQRVYI